MDYRGHGRTFLRNQQTGMNTVPGFIGSFKLVFQGINNHDDLDIIQLSHLEISASPPGLPTFLMGQ